MNGFKIDIDEIEDNYVYQCSQKVITQIVKDQDEATYKELTLLLEHIDNLHSKIDKANEILNTLCVVKPYESVNGEIHKYYRPVKNTTKQEVYKAICDLREILKEDK